MKRWALVAALALAGCSAADGADSPPWGAPPDLLIWPADAAMADLVTLAAVRVEAASGLRVALTDAVGTGVPAFWSDRAEWWVGYAHEERFMTVDQRLSPDGPSRATVALHEVLHLLGAGHVESGLGVMHRDFNDATLAITAADLEALCSRAPCSKFEPELGD